MSKLVRRHWPSDLSAGLSRRDRRGCEYAAYIPDLLVDRRFRFGGDVAADLVEAEASIALLNEKATALGDTEALARLLLRAECVASSQIEGGPGGWRTPPPPGGGRTRGWSEARGRHGGGGPRQH